MTLEIDKAKMSALLKRVEKAPKNIQRYATSSALTAGAKVVTKEAKSKAPSCLKHTIKATKRRSKGLSSTLKVVAGNSERPKDVLSANEILQVRGAGSSLLDCLPAIWVEFGTYGNRDYQGSEPYAPSTLRKRNYSTGRSDSKFWGVPRTWVPSQPFMRPSVDAKGVDVAMAKRLNEYLEKKGF